MKRNLANAARRWIVTLCVALVAFAAVGHIDAFAQVSAEAAFSQSGTQQQDGSSELPAADHCCCAHSVGVPPGALSNAIHPKLGSGFAQGFTPFIASRDPNALERPPRVISAA